MMGHGRFIPEKEPSKLLAAVFASLLIVSSRVPLSCFDTDKTLGMAGNSNAFLRVTNRPFQRP